MGDLESPHAVIKAVAGVQAQALAGLDPASAPFPLHGVSPANPVLYQQAHPTTGVIPPLLCTYTLQMLVVLAHHPETLR